MNTKRHQDDSFSDSKNRKVNLRGAKRSRAGKIFLAVALSVASVVGCVALVRATVDWVSDEPADPDAVRAANASHRSLSPNSAEAIAERKRRGAEYVADAIHEEEEFMRERKQRLWAERNQARPDHRDVYANWKTKVERIEAKIAEAATVEGAYDEDGNVVENSILWHQMERLKVLQADAPLTY